MIDKVTTDDITLSAIGRLTNDKIDSALEEILSSVDGSDPMWVEVYFWDDRLGDVLASGFINITQGNSVRKDKLMVQTNYVEVTADEILDRVSAVIRIIQKHTKRFPKKINVR